MARSPTVAPTRRPAYGSNPTLGPHGNRARQEILAAALALFDAHGYQAVTIEAIGAATGRSGASVYQYFANKHDLFMEFVDDLGTDLLRQAGRLGPLAPTASGFDGLRSWFDGIGGVLWRHMTTFRLWAGVEYADHTLLGPAASFVELFGRRVAPRLQAAGVPASGADALALTLLRMVERSHFIQDAWFPRSTPADLTEALARVVQLALFPEEAARFENSTLGLSGAAEHPGPAGRSRRIIPTDPTRSMRRTPTGRGEATVRQISAAANDVFARKGLAAASVPDIVTAAGVGHGTFYSYWPDLASVFDSLAGRAMADLAQFVAGVGSSPEPALAFPDAMAAWIPLAERHRGVLRVWSQEELPTAALRRQRTHTVRQGAAMFHHLLAHGPYAAVLPARQAAVIAAALLVCTVPDPVESIAASVQHLAGQAAYLLGRGVFGVEVDPGAVLPESAARVWSGGENGPAAPGLVERGPR